MKNSGIVLKTFMASVVMIFYFSACKKENQTNTVEHDPSKPVVIARFSPESGRVATQMLIYGSNFGSDRSKISVTIRDKNAAVINVSEDGTIIYCIVPTLRGSEIVEDGEQVTGSIKVKIGEKEVTAGKEFSYTFSQNVSTFLGYTDQDGNSSIIDGDFEKAQFERPFWITFDRNEGPGKPRNIFVLEEDRGLRFINMKTKTVETLFRVGDNLWRPRTIAFTLDNDTMIIANDAGNWTDIGTIILLRQPDGSFPVNTWTTVMNHKQCNGGAIHPISNEYWFNSYDKSQVYKVKNRTNIPWVYGNATGNNTNGSEGTNYVFLVQDNGWEFNIQIAPSGKFAYIVSRNKHYLARMDYNFSTNYFDKPQPYVGSINKPGFLDGVGTNTLFNQPQQGAFDNEDNFYVTDAGNHCIRKITPTGQVSTFAGRPGAAGYSDGAPRDAQFNFPLGIAYDNTNQTFYVGDRDNHRIRAIVIQ